MITNDIIQDHEQARVVAVVGTKMQIDLHAITYMRDERCERFSSHIGTFGAYPALIQHVSCAIAGARGDSASVAYATEVNDLAAVCDAVTPRAARAVPSACSACICHISSAAALARGDARAAADLFVSVCVSERDKRENAKDDYKRQHPRPRVGSRFADIISFHTMSCGLCVCVCQRERKRERER